MRRALLTFALVVALASPSLGAPIGGGGVPDDRVARPRELPMERGQEYFSAASPSELLISVRILGAVARPGVYHVPKKTDLLSLLALAGGVRADADHSAVTIRRTATEVETVQRIDLTRQMKEVGAATVYMEANDIVVVDFDEPLVSQNSLTLIGFVASILSVLVSGLFLTGRLGGG